MPKKYRNKVAIGTYLAIFWGIAFFGLSFVYEGWEVKGIEPLLTPLGIGSMVLIATCIVLFIWNLRREELSHEQWLEIKNHRLPELAQFRKTLRAYLLATYKVSRKKELFNLSSYGIGENPPWYFFWSATMLNNRVYQKLKEDDREITRLREILVSLTSSLNSKKLFHLLDISLIKEQMGRSYQIMLRVFRVKYPISLELEKKMLKSEARPLFAQQLKTLYKYITEMEGGKDIG
jgi:flagellin-specific chaperone FliS